MHEPTKGDINAARTPPRDDVMWTVQDIATYLQIEFRQARDRVTHAPDFPKPLRIGGKTKRWVPREVKRWAGE